MTAAAEAEVLGSRVVRNVEARAVDGLRIGAARLREQVDRRALGHVDPVDIAVLRRLAGDPRGGRPHPHDLLNRIGGQLGALAQQRPLLRVADEEVHGEAELVAGRVDTALEQEDDRRPQLGVAEAVAVLVGIDQGLQEVILRRCTALRDQPVGVDAHLLEAPLDLVQALLRGDREREAHLFGVERELFPVAVVDAEQAADHPGRVRLGELVHELALPVVDEAVDEFVRQLLELRHEPLDVAR